MDSSFQGVQWAAPADLGVSQLYLDRSKLEEIRKWFHPGQANLCEPLPVHDFGNGRLTLTDGHSRAFVAHQYKEKVPIIYDTDDLVIGEEGRLLYRNSLSWCERFQIQKIGDLVHRIVEHSEYGVLWDERCDRAYYLLTQTDEHERMEIQRRTELFLYGADKGLTVYYFEDAQGRRFECEVGEGKRVCRPTRERVSFRM